MTLVLGVGNLFRRDDGVGIHVIRRLEGAGLPSSVRLLDGGTAGLDLVTYLEGVDRLIIVDALVGDGSPGDIRIIREEETQGDHFLSGHLGRVGDILDMTAALWKRPETTIIGVLAADCSGYGECLTPGVVPAVEKAVRIIEEMVRPEAADGQAVC